jgi:hypothetical protein
MLVREDSSVRWIEIWVKPGFRDTWTQVQDGDHHRVTKSGKKEERYRLALYYETHLPAM